MALAVLVVLCSFLYKPHSIESKHEVTILSGLNEFVVKFHGPPGSMCQTPSPPSYILIKKFQISQH